MNRDIIAGQWNRIKGEIRERWGKLTDDDLDQIAGRRDQLIGAIQIRYGRDREAVEEELKEWEQRREASFGL